MSAALTGKSEGRHVLVGTLQRDRLGWNEFVKLGGKFVRFWIWDALAEMPAGRKVRITIEVLDER